MSERILSLEKNEEDIRGEKSLRPAFLQEYVGQRKVKDNLSLFMEAARQRGDALDHVLLAGPPGLGKTTLAHIIAHEMGSNLHVVTGPNVEKKGTSLLFFRIFNLEMFSLLMRFIDSKKR